MPRRKANYESLRTSRKRTAEQPSPPTDCSPPKDLVGWIRHLRAEYLKEAKQLGGNWLANAPSNLEIIREKSKAFDSYCWVPTDRQLIERISGRLPKENTFHEALLDRLLVVWADAEFWRIIRGYPKHPLSKVTLEDITYVYLRDRYHLQILFPVSVWLEMVREPTQRAHLFLLMVTSAPRFFWVRSLDPKQNLQVGSRAKLFALVNNYIRFPTQDWRPSLLLGGYSREELELLRFVVNRLAKDITSVISHPDRLEARRAPPIAHRIRRLKEVKAIEDMVLFLRLDHGLTDNALAKQSMGRITAAGRKLAHEARLLAYYRDGLPVTFHKSFGQKKMRQ